MKDVNILLNAGVNVQASLELLGDMEMYDDTLNDFLDMVDEKKGKLEKFLADNDMPNYAIEIHALKSDARYLGFLELGDLAYDSEMKSKAGDSAGVNANHPTIMEKLQNMITIASSYLGRAVAAPAASAQPTANVEQPQMTQPMAAQPMMQAQPAMQSVQQPVMQSQMQPMQSPNTMNQGYAMPSAQPMMQAQPAMQSVQQPAMQPQMQTMQPQMTQGYAMPAAQPMMQPQPMTQPTMQPQMTQGYAMPASQPVQQTEAIYDLATGTIQHQPVSQPAVQPMMDPMSQALYTQQQNAMHQMPTNLMPKAGTILVVDDSNLVANFVKKIFDTKYDVVIANDGAKAIELCADDNFRSKIKACLLDLNMPNVDGYQVLEDFYGKGYFVKMPIAVISGVEDMDSIDKANKYPIIDVLAKPFNERDVQRVVEKCLAAYF